MNIEINLIDFFEKQASCIEDIKKKKGSIKEIIELLIHARNQKKRIFIMGNGGSGSTASHFCSDLLKTAIIKKQKRFQAFSLVDNIPVILAWSNDVSYDSVFVEQLKNFLTKDDILIGFSGSGNSKNIINAFEYGKKIGAVCIGFTGVTGGLMKKYCKICIRVNSDDMLTIEAQHVIIFHGIVETVRKMGDPLFKY